MSRHVAGANDNKPLLKLIFSPRRVLKWSLAREQTARFFAGFALQNR